MVLKERVLPCDDDDILAGIAEELAVVYSQYHDYDDETSTGGEVESEGRRRGRNRVRTSHQARPLSHQDCRVTRKRKAGCRFGRRLENARDILLLREEGEELDVNDICPDSYGLFGSLFSEEHSMKTWEKFINKSEEEQRELLDCRRAVHADIAEPAESSPTVTKCLQRIDRNMRGTLRKHKKHIAPTLADIEQDLSEFFSESPDAIVVLKMDSSFHRMLLHAVSQFLALNSSSEDIFGDRLTQIETDGSFVPPSVPLAECLTQL